MTPAPAVAHRPAAGRAPRNKTATAGATDRPMTYAAAAPAGRARLAGQQQERGLEGIVGVRAAAEHAAADALHHRAVAADQFGERLLVAAAGKGGEQLAVASRGGTRRTGQAD